MPDFRLRLPPAMARQSDSLLRLDSVTLQLAVLLAMVKADSPVAVPRPAMTTEKGSR